MEREIANIDEFQMDEYEIPLLPAGLKEEGNLYVPPRRALPPLRSLQDRGRRLAHL